MARVKVLLPDEFKFSVTIPVRISDINYGGHLGNDAVLSIIHEARLQYLAHYGYSEMNFAGVGLIMADAALEFKQEAFYGDVIIVSIAASDFGRITFDLYYKLEKIVEDKRVPVAFAKTGMVCFDYTQKKAIPIPKEVVNKLQNL